MKRFIIRSLFLHAAYLIFAASPVQADDLPRFSVSELLDLRSVGINVVAICPASREMFISHSGSKQEILELHQWNIDEKKLLHTYTCPKGSFKWDEVAISPDGKLLVASTYPEHLGAKAKVFFIDTRTHKMRFTADYDSLVRTIRFDHSGKYVLIHTTTWNSPNAFAYDRDGKERANFDPKDFEPVNKDRLWNVANSKSQRPLPGLFYRDDGGLVHHLLKDPLNEHYALTTDGRFVATSTWDQKVRIWRTSDLKEVFNEKMGAHPVVLFYDSKENQFLVLSNDNAHLRAIKLP